MTALRVALLTQWYPPEPVLQPHWIARGLIHEGATCEVVTGVPNYPTGRTMNGYRAWCPMTESVAEVPVHRSPLYPDHGSNVAKRLANYVSWAVSSALFGRSVLANVDVVLVYFSPATAAFAAMVNRWRGGTPYVLLVQDVWPDSIMESGFLPGPFGRVAGSIMGRLVDRAYRSAESIIVTSPGMRDLLVQRGVPASKLTLIYNWVSPERGAEPPTNGLRKALALEADDFVLMYAGNHGAAQGLEDVVDAFAQLPFDDRSHLVLVGSGIEEEALRRRAGTAYSRRIHFLGRHERSTVEAWMHEADAQLVSLADRPLFHITTPSKLQASLAAGQPILVNARGDAADLVADASAGVAASPGNRSSLVSAIERLRMSSAEQRHRWGANGRSFYEQHMSASVGAKRMVGVLCAAAGSHDGGRLPADDEAVDG